MSLDKFKNSIVNVIDGKGRAPEGNVLPDLIRFRTAYYPGDKRRIAPN